MVRVKGRLHWCTWINEKLPTLNCPFLLSFNKHIASKDALGNKTSTFYNHLKYCTLTVFLHTSPKWDTMITTELWNSVLSSGAQIEQSFVGFSGFCLFCYFGKLAFDLFQQCNFFLDFSRNYHWLWKCYWMPSPLFTHHLRRGFSGFQGK